MPAVERSEVVAYTPEQMYELVLDIEAYPEFLSWCGSGRILSQEEDALIAELTLEHRGLRKSFATRNRFHRPKLVEMRLIHGHGPFQFLEGVWTFEPQADARTRVHVSIQYEFVSRFLTVVMGPIFYQAVDTLVVDFRQRAEVVYGQPKNPNRRY